MVYFGLLINENCRRYRFIPSNSKNSTSLAMILNVITHKIQLV